MNKKLALTLGLLLSFSVALPSNAGPVFRLIYGSDPADPVVDTDGVTGLIDTDIPPRSRNVEYGLLVENPPGDDTTVDFNINDTVEVISITPAPGVDFSNINATFDDVLNFTVTSGSLGLTPDDDLADFTVSITGDNVADPITGGSTPNLSVDLQTVDLQTVPEPMTILGSLAVLGFGGLMKKNQSKKSS